MTGWCWEFRDRDHKLSMKLHSWVIDQIAFWKPWTRLAKLFVGLNNVHLFFKSRPTPASFCLFSFFSNTILYRKNCTLQQDWNSDYQSRRQARWPHNHHQGPSLTSQVEFFLYFFRWGCWLGRLSIVAGPNNLLHRHRSAHHVLVHQHHREPLRQGIEVGGDILGEGEGAVANHWRVILSRHWASFSSRQIQANN